MSLTLKALGAQLREIRQGRGLSLAQVEQTSGGHWKAVVVGSYERGDRAITAVRLDELLRWYGAGDRLAIVGTAAGHNAEQHAEYGVRLAAGQVIAVQDLSEAAGFTAAIPGSEVVTRVITATDWTRHA